ncbi:MAG: hypothetical protein ACTH2Y_13735 [Corynebacterium sp.]|uniref:hypothetical protein n=1 Tax=unclassified Corynebacterium TaxID=2624378 RepID=UPI0026493CC1|nr:hypothetical protein [Corynebacterium sp.]MDN5721248.1 hypothetical protein [Corynebacterium sp.]MDN6387937.1 hypothetical protein [Corynebacterium sp.]
MPPKVSDNHTTSAESLHTVEEETAKAAQRIVATYADDFLDAATLMCMLGVEPEGLIHRKVAADAAAEEEAKNPKAAKKTTAKKATKKTAKKAPAKKATKTTAKKTTAKKAATSTTAKKDSGE